LSAASGDPPEAGVSGLARRRPNPDRRAYAEGRRLDDLWGPRNSMKALAAFVLIGDNPWLVK
jgi:hypothetical protein